MSDEDQECVAYVTKYALTKGIVRQRGTRKTVQGTEYFKPENDRSFTLYKWGKDAFGDLEEARTRAREVIGKKVSSVRRQLKKLEKLASSDLEPVDG